MNAKFKAQFGYIIVNKRLVLNERHLKTIEVDPRLANTWDIDGLCAAFEKYMRRRMFDDSKLIITKIKFGCYEFNLEETK